MGESSPCHCCGFPLSLILLALCCLLGDLKLKEGGVNNSNCLHGRVRTHICRVNVTDYFARLAANPDPVVAAGYAPKEENSPALSVALSSAQSRSHTSVTGRAVNGKTQLSLLRCVLIYPVP